MNKVFKLACSFLKEHPVRVVLTTIATTAATCLVVFIASGYEALHKTYDEYADLALGRYTLAVAPISMEADDYVPTQALDDLKKDANVVAVDPMWACKLRVRARASAPISSESSPRGGGQFSGGPGSGPNANMPEMLFLATAAPAPPFEMLQGRWLENTDATEVVLRADVAKKRGLKLEDHLRVESPDGKSVYQLRVVGLVNSPSLPGPGEGGIPILAPSSGQAFLSFPLAEKILEKPRKISLLGVGVSPEADLTKFRFGWSFKLSGYATPVQFQEAFEIEEALDQAQAARTVRLQSYMATAVAMLVALLVVSCTLSMGVTERIRQYAILRAITFTRGQVALLIFFEGILLGILGLIGGLSLGWILLGVVEVSYSRLLYHGVAFGWHSVTLAVLASMGGALLACVIPVYRATRVRPIDALAPPAQTAGTRRAPTLLAALGILLIAVNPIITFVVPQTESSVFISTAIGFVSMTLGFIFLAPLLVGTVDRVVSPLLARIFLIDSKLLANQISSHQWRTASAAISMAFGMGLFVGVQVWGFTMLQAFIPGSWCPDAVISFQPGVTQENVRAIAKLPQIDGKRCLPMVVEQPRLLRDLTGSTERASVTRQDNIVLVGLDPEGAFGEENPLFQLEWVAGNADQAVEWMTQGRGCVVPDHFLVETGLKVGDTMALVPPENPIKPVEYKIAGAVRLPGWHWQTKLTGLRPRTHRAAALVIADFQSVSRDFHLPKASHVWCAFSSPRPDVEKLNQDVLALQKNFQENHPTDQPVVARVIPVQGIRDHLQNIARRWIWLVSQVPLIAMAIACLAVVNVLIASVRSRQWELGVLRAVGFTNSELVRAILAEGLLIAVVASVLSVSFGILGGWCGCGMAQHFSFFGGLHPPMVMPWAALAYGLTLLLTLGTLSAVWPAIMIGKKRPLQLLQNGPSSI